MVSKQKFDPCMNVRILRETSAIALFSPYVWCNELGMPQNYSNETYNVNHILMRVTWNEVPPGVYSLEMGRTLNTLFTYAHGVLLRPCRKMWDAFLAGLSPGYFCGHSESTSLMASSDERVHATVRLRGLCGAVLNNCTWPWNFKVPRKRLVISYA